MNTKIRITDVLQNILVCNMIFSLEFRREQIVREKNLKI